MKPSFAGSTVNEFKKHMSMVFNNMISVATNWQGGDDRTCLSGYIPTQEAAGYLIAVRESEETPTEIYWKWLKNCIRKFKSFTQVDCYWTRKTLDLINDSTTFVLRHPC